jgi:hypothetical protein
MHQGNWFAKALEFIGAWWNFIDIIVDNVANSLDV